MLFVGLISFRAIAAGTGYFTVKEQAVSSSQPAPTMEPLQTLDSLWQQVQEDLGELSAGNLFLLNFEFHPQKNADPSEAYNRKQHFGTWIVDRRNENCLSTRGQVLVRDSSVPVQLSRSGCTVASGHWADPYGARDYTASADIHIDHFVPLKNAYLSGAHKWNYQKRCLYANFLGNSFHLLSVYSRENSRKGDRTPEEYMPPNSAYQCQYLAQWLKVKLIWALTLTSEEKDKVIELARLNHCRAEELSFSDSELLQQRTFIADNMNLCH